MKVYANFLPPAFVSYDIII